MQIADFVEKWNKSGAAERANKDSYLRDLCDVLGVPHPDPTTGDAERDRYVFEKDAPFRVEGDKVTIRKIDLYKAGCFILEAKQGSEQGALKLGTARRGMPPWHWEMQKAYGQALGYARSFDRPPPFLIVADLGYCFDLFASFDGSHAYAPFPAAQTSRIHVKDLAAHVDTLRAVFTDPLSLDPSRRSIAVTREVAAHLAELKRALDKDKHSPEEIAKFLMRCLFTMFAEDVGLLPERMFTDAVEKLWLESPKSFPGGIESLWRAMNDGTSFGFVGKLLKFNGGLFKSPTALPLDVKQLRLLLEAAKCDWSEVEPAIFGTLLERALDAKERHALGAHFTPRAYVERLVRPTIEEPLRADWDVVQVEVRQLVEASERQQTRKAADQKLKAAVACLKEFHKKLANVQILDPACGTGNFLYVSLDILKRLENEVVTRLSELGESALLELEGVRVTPAQFHGIEIKPWAKEIAELVLWIGYLQWQARATGKKLNQNFEEPVLRDYGNIECRDAVLAYDHEELLRDANGKPVTHWDGETMKKHPVTGGLVPDERFTMPVYSYTNPRKAEWPGANFIVGNPPFIGNKRMRGTLGDGYVDALRAAHSDVSDASDYVMYWWHKAAQQLQGGRTRGFGLITTNSISQSSNRGIIEAHMLAKRPLRLSFAVPDHPWVDSQSGAAVRIAMTVADLELGAGVLSEVRNEQPTADGTVAVDMATRSGMVHRDLSVGPDIAGAVPLRANSGLSFMGVTLIGDGFRLDRDDLTQLGLNEQALPPVVKPYRSGRELTQKAVERWIVDLFGLSEEDARARYPALMQRLMDTVFPLRAQNARESYRRKWWIFGEPRREMRNALAELPRYIATLETSKHRVFLFLTGETVPDHSLYAIALSDAFSLGVLSSRIHVGWSLAAGGTLEDRPRYRNGPCFDPFPFPAPTDVQRQRIRALAESLDGHRKSRQNAHPELTITGMYGVVEKLRAGEPLTAKDRVTHEQGLVSVLKKLHDDLDAAVFEAYGWPQELTDEQVLEGLLTLNAERAEQERKGVVHWLRADFQNVATAKPMTQVTLMRDEGPSTAATPGTAVPWPKKLPEQIAAVRDLVLRSPTAWTANQAAGAFKGGKPTDVEPVLESLAALGLLVSWLSGTERQWKAAKA